MAKTQRRRRPATTLEGRENQLISLAVDFAERQMIEGNAPAMIVSHFLKLGSTRERLEQSKIQNENLLLAAKVDQMKSARKVEELYAEALIAMREYQGQPRGEEEEEYYDEL